MCRSTFFNLGTSWKLLASFTPRPLHPRERKPRFPLDRRLGGPQSRSGRRGEETILTLPGLERRPLGRPIRSQSLYRRCYPGTWCKLLTVVCPTADTPTSSVGVVFLLVSLRCRALRDDKTMNDWEWVLAEWSCWQKNGWSLTISWNDGPTKLVFVNN
jgi:hypothetical protein